MHILNFTQLSKTEQTRALLNYGRLITSREKHIGKVYLYLINEDSPHEKFIEVYCDNNDNLMDISPLKNIGLINLYIPATFEL